MTLQDALNLYLPQIEDELNGLVGGARSIAARYYSMMRYHFGWMDETLKPARKEGGKRLRPILCLLSCRAVGGETASALPAACAVELVHNFSLVHDDIQDNSTVRRGRRTVWDLWGTAHGINVGDGLFVLARLALDQLPGRGVALHRFQAAAQALDQACLALCEGQFLDMYYQGRSDVGVEQYLKMIGLKTAALLSTSACLGAIVATDEPQIHELFRQFGHYLGLAFQIQDDMLGIWGDEETTGKSAATDLRDKKMTLPIAYVLSLTSSPAASRMASDLYAEPGPLDERGIRSVLALLEAVEAHRYAQESAEHYLSLALSYLDRLQTRGYDTNTLRELARSLLDRRL